MNSPYVEASTITEKQREAEMTSNGDEESFVAEAASSAPRLEVSSSGTAMTMVANGSTHSSQGSSTPATWSENFRSYVKSGNIVELLGWVCAMALLSALPRLTARTNWRDIPYQRTAAGDILLETIYDNSLVDETVPNELLVIVGIVIPFILQIILCLILAKPFDVHRTICTYAASLGISTFTIEFVKHYVGYLRPNFYEKCGFDYDTLQCDPSIDSNEFTGRKSFMSGHSSMSFAALTVFSLYLQQHFGVGSGPERRAILQPIEMEESINGMGANIIFHYRLSRPSRAKRVLSVLCLLPIFVAVFIAASRVHDNYHHPADVVGGSVVGAACALFSMGLWFPKPTVQVLSG